MSVVTLTLGPQQRKVMLAALNLYIGEMLKHTTTHHPDTPDEIRNALARKRDIAINLRRDLENG